MYTSAQQCQENVGQAGFRSCPSELVSKERTALQETSADQFSFPGLEKEAIQPGRHHCLQYRQNEVDQICMWDSTSTLVGIPALHI